jgi:hypothetical protein
LAQAITPIAYDQRWPAAVNFTVPVDIFVSGKTSFSLSDGTVQNSVDEGNGYHSLLTSLPGGSLTSFTCIGTADMWVLPSAASLEPLTCSTSDAFQSIAMRFNLPRFHDDQGNLVYMDTDYSSGDPSTWRYLVNATTGNSFDWWPMGSGLAWNSVTVRDWGTNNRGLIEFAPLQDYAAGGLRVEYTITLYLNGSPSPTRVVLDWELFSYFDPITPPVIESSTEQVDSSGAEVPVVFNGYFDITGEALGPSNPLIIRPRFGRGSGSATTTASTVLMEFKFIPRSFRTNTLLLI